MNYKTLLIWILAVIGLDIGVRLVSMGFIPLYPRFTYESALPHFIASFANFDGVHYLTIAEKGYRGNTYAFFPLYPLFVHLVSFGVHNHFLAAMMVTLAAFIAGVLIFQRYAQMVLANRRHAMYAILFLLLFPTSFFLTSVYTEALFFYCLMGFFYCMAAKKPRIAAAFGFFAALTRFIGVFLVVPVIVLMIFNKKEYKKYLPALGAPLLGLGVYALYLWITTGDPLKFFHVQPSFGANRSTQLIMLPQVYYRYFKIFFQSAVNYQYWVAVLEFTVTTFVLMILSLDLRSVWRNKHLAHRADRLALNAFSWINILVPTLTGTLLSIPRFSLMSLSIFLYLAGLKSTVLKIALLGVFFILHILLLAHFTQGYFVS